MGLAGLYTILDLQQLYTLRWFIPVPDWNLAHASLWNFRLPVWDLNGLLKTLLMSWPGILESLQSMSWPWTSQLSPSMMSHTEPKHAQRDESIGLAQRDIYIFHVASCGIKSALIKLQQAPTCDQVSAYEKRAIHVVKMLKELRWDGCDYCISQMVTATTIKYLLAFCVEMLRAWIVGSLDRWCSPQTWYTVLQLFLQTTSNRAKMKLDS